MNGSSTHTHKTAFEFKIEFLISSPDSARVLRDPSYISYIQSLFEVSVSTPGTQTPRGEWIALRGRQEHTAKAKKYILALCSPEVRVEACRHPSFAQFLFGGEGRKVRRKLEIENQAVLTCGADGVVLIQGAENDVYATNTKLLSLMGTFPNGHSLRYLPPSTNPQPMTNGETLYNHKPPMRQEMIPSHEAARYNSVIARGGDPGREKRIQYFVDLGYSRDMVETVLCRLSDAADDVVLNRLVQCTPQQPRLPGGVVDPLPARPMNPELLRHIVIDGSNVAMKHGNGHNFSCKGIQLAVDYFKRRGHPKITVFVPEWRKEASTPDFPITNQQILHSLEQDGHLKYTPSRRIEGRRIVCYDDRFIIKLATDEQGVIVSNDQYRDLVREKAEWKEIIETRLLQFTFANDYFMPPDDPLGRNGPTLDQLLSKDPQISGQTARGKKLPPVPGQQPCPFGERCTFGRKCKYWHPDRETSSSNPSTASHTPSTSRSPTPSPSPDKRHIVRSREDLVKPSVYHENQISLPELNDQMSQMSMIHNRPESINLQQYPPQMMRSNPNLPTPQDPALLSGYEGVHQERRQLNHTFPLLTLPAQQGYDRRYTEDLTRQAVTPSRLQSRAHTHEHEYQYEQPRHLTGFPGPHPPPGGYGNLVPRDGGTGRGVPSYSPRHYPHPPLTQSYSHHQLVPSPQPPRLRAYGDHAPLYDETVFRKALAVLPGCEDRLRRVFNQYPRISNYEEAVDLARRID